MEKAKTFHSFQNGAVTSLSSKRNVKVRRTLAGNIPKLYAPWKRTTVWGTASMGKYWTTGLDTNGTFMWFHTPPGGKTKVASLPPP
jgi:hypothetical protein